MDLHEIAEAEGTDVLQLFVRASRLFAKCCPHPSTDYQKWEKDGSLPPYIQEYARYWQRLNRTETTNSRMH